MGDDKELNLSFAKSIGQAKREMAKCIVLCSNCHRIRHWDATHSITDTEVIHEAVEGAQP